MPSGFNCPFSASVKRTLSAGTPLSEASRPAGAFHTPRWVSVRENTPATTPHGAKLSIWPFGAADPASAGAGKNRRIPAASPLSAKPSMPASHSSLSLQALGAIHDQHGALSRAESCGLAQHCRWRLHPGARSGGMQSRLKIWLSNLSKA